MKKLLVLLLLSVFIMSSCTTPITPIKSSEGKVAAGTLEGNMAPDFTLKDIDGKDVKLSDYRGKTVILNFFGVWCGWCVKEMPGFIKVYNEYKNKNVELLVVDSGDTKAKLQEYLANNSFNIKPVLDDKNTVVKLYKVNGFPTSYIIDSKGFIQRVHRGYMEEDALRSVLNTIVK